MSEIVADCPRCGAGHITFDLNAQNLFLTRYNWQNWYEAFCVCRKCHRATILVVKERGIPEAELVGKHGLSAVGGGVNNLVDVHSFVNISDLKSASPPEHLPDEIQSIFSEGATCLSVGCFNASGTMFRLCVDLATKALLPKEDVQGLNSKIRRNLGFRLPWLFGNGYLPVALQELSSCVKEDGNDGAHDGTLEKEDAEDLLDFTFALLERLYTEPERLRLAKERREARRAGAGQ